MLTRELKSSEVLVRAFSRKISILIAAEDDLLLIDQLIHGLEKMGHNVAAVARSAEAVIPIARLCCADLIVIDVSRASDDFGIAMALHIANVLPLPVVFITAYNADLQSVGDELQLPHRVLTKPVLTAALHQAIDDLLS